jgi:lysine N6-hydroxylase
MTGTDEHDVVGIGCGPSNLSLAALAHPLEDLSTVFLERHAEFAWHPGLRFEDSRLQVSYLKDLVTLVDPTSRFSFLNFLAVEGRLYRFLNAGIEDVTRLEFEQYYRWVADRIDAVRFGVAVRAVEFDGQLFIVKTDRASYRARHLAVATGQVTHIPGVAAAALGDAVFHASEFSQRNVAKAGARTLVVGGGQSGAEIVHHLLTRWPSLPGDLTWVSSRENFLPRDDSAFVNEWFGPSYSTHFQGLAPHRRAALLKLQRLASDGIAESLLRAIYREFYRHDYLDPRGLRHRLLPSHRLIDLRQQPTARGWFATLWDEDTQEQQVVEADVVVLATGFRQQVPDCLAPLRDRLRMTADGVVLREDYSLEWDGPEDRRIFVLNGGSHTHGIADPNLSLLAWRAAVILNSVAGRMVYRIDRHDSVLW